MAESSYFLIRTRLLATKIIGWKAQHYNVLAILSMESFPVGILRREATFGGHIDEYYFLALVLAQVDCLVANQGLHFKIV